MGDLAELDLHAFAIGEPHPEPFALLHIALRNLHAALGQPSQRMQWVSRAGPSLVG